MKTALAVIVLLSLSLGLAAQTVKQQPPARPQAAPQASDPALNAIVSDLQRVSQATTGDLGKLRIDKWKADGSQKQQMQQVAESLQRNLTQAVPGLISDLQASPGSVSKAFKLYHNVTVVYEFLDSLSQAAGAYGKKEEYDPLSSDASNLDQVRQKLSDYIDQSAVALENQVKKATPPKTTATQGTQTQTPKKIVIDDSTPTTKKKKKPSPVSNPTQ
ncbi:MAG TPA: hypothetical protein VI685_24350 [Candidatus Angelobacter sp.]